MDVFVDIPDLLDVIPTRKEQLGGPSRQTRGIVVPMASPLPVSAVSSSDVEGLDSQDFVVSETTESRGWYWGRIRK